MTDITPHPDLQKIISESKVVPVQTSENAFIFSGWNGTQYEIRRRDDARYDVETLWFGNKGFFNASEIRFLLDVIKFVKETITTPDRKELK